MFWGLPLLLRMFVGDLWGKYLLKRTVSHPDRLSALCLQFVYCLVLALAYYLLHCLFTSSGNGSTNTSAPSLWDPRLLTVVGLGIASSYATYCQWRAVDISLSKSSVFSWAPSFVAIILGLWILGEGAELGKRHVLAIGLCLVAVVLLTWGRSRGSRKDHSHAKPMVVKDKWKLGILVAQYSVIWGVAIFSFRYFSVGALPLPSYVLAWYIGSLLGALVIRFFSAEVVPRKLSIKSEDKSLIRQLSLSVWGSLVLTYWCLSLAPLVVVQPLLHMSGLLLPTLLGLITFKEKQALTLASASALVMACTGGIILALI